jgi:hypothetical protein
MKSLAISPDLSYSLTKLGITAEKLWILLEYRPAPESNGANV